MHVIVYLSNQVVFISIKADVTKKCVAKISWNFQINDGQLSLLRFQCYLQQCHTSCDMQYSFDKVPLMRYTKCIFHHFYSCDKQRVCDTFLLAATNQQSPIVFSLVTTDFLRLNKIFLYFLSLRFMRPSCNYDGTNLSDFHLSVL